LPYPIAATGRADDEVKAGTVGMFLPLAEAD
jgi:hypothetical protein